MPSEDPIESEFADDPEMTEIVALFVAALPRRMEAVVAALSGGERAALRVLAHQLKGAGGGYGFPAITEAAARLEHALGQGAPEAELEHAAAALVAVCARVRGPAAGAGPAWPAPGGPGPGAPPAA